MTGLENGESTGFDSSLLTQFLAGVTSTVERIQAVEDVLKTAGASWRNLIGPWITRLVPAQNLVPERHQDLRPLVEDAFQFVFSRLSDHRLAVKLVEQVEMPVDAPPETRLIKLIAKMPGLQKLGQVLARNRRLSPALREALSELENSMADVGPEEMTSIIASQLGSRMQTYQVEIEPAIFKEGSASAILRFTWRNPGKESDRGVFKVLKPYVVSYFAEDMTLLQQLGEYLSTGDGNMASRCVTSKTYWRRFDSCWNTNWTFRSNSGPWGRLARCTVRASGSVCRAWWLLSAHRRSPQ